ncbi:MAG: hypothetical protein M0R33_13990 [Methylomonas sp.]|jgi:hypothetical protein|uniref:hypothetical protein n=1 Tax=Methylomonas sp. TaxID=418 RepID=UPI0025ED7557|nr:hypothetical protein [Methylomonas sp.]MCK9607547.1 hypothetical protein [Methylomonas sp.]
MQNASKEAAKCNYAVLEQVVYVIFSSREAVEALPTLRSLDCFAGVFLKFVLIESTITQLNKHQEEKMTSLAQIMCNNVDPLLNAIMFGTSVVYIPETLKTMLCLRAVSCEMKGAVDDFLLAKKAQIFAKISEASRIWSQSFNSEAFQQATAAEVAKNRLFIPTLQNFAQLLFNNGMPSKQLKQHLIVIFGDRKAVKRILLNFPWGF